MKSFNICETCGKKAHNFKMEEAMECVPPVEVLIFGEHHMDNDYRKALYNAYPMYTSEEVVGSFLGQNPYFPSQSSWIDTENLKSK